MTRAVRRVLLLLLGLGLFASPVRATWSVIVVHKKTREVCSAVATCIEGVGLENLVPVIVVGKGAGASQGFVMSNAQNRKLIFKGFKKGYPPERILEWIEATDSSIQSRGFGIVSFAGPPVAFIGDKLGDGKGTTFGETEDLIYAIQGSGLAGASVVQAAEQALLYSEGDLSTRVMLAMEAARFMGGDGRCSCHPTKPDSCGTPPPDFEKSAHQAVLFLARPGDINGTCSGAEGCANGEYYLGLVSGGSWDDVDPVVELRQQFVHWRASLVGVPDHYRSEASIDRQRIVADGASRAHVTIRLRDLDGTPLTQGGAVVSLKRKNPLPPKATVGPVIDNGDGTYSVELTATTDPGIGEWRVDVDLGGPRIIQLSPTLLLTSDPLTELHAGIRQFSLSDPTPVPFTLNRPASDAGRSYRILGSFSGTEPGVLLGGVQLALNPDRFFRSTWLPPGPDGFEGSHGDLDVVGRAEAYLQPSPLWSPALVGQRLDFQAWLPGATPAATNGVWFEIAP